MWILVERKRNETLPTYKRRERGRGSDRERERERERATTSMVGSTFLSSLKWADRSDKDMRSRSSMFRVSLRLRCRHGLFHQEVSISWLTLVKRYICPDTTPRQSEDCWRELLATVRWWSSKQLLPKTETLSKHLSYCILLPSDGWWLDGWNDFVAAALQSPNLSMLLLFAYHKAWCGLWE